MLTSFDEVNPAEHQARLARVQSVTCPKCEARKGEHCKLLDGSKTLSSHQERWDKYYKGMKHNA